MPQRKQTEDWKTTLRVPMELKEELETQAEKEERSLNNIIIRAIREYLNARDTSRSS